MRVLVVCDWFLKYATSQSAALRRAGMDVFLLCRDHASEFGGSSEERQEVFRGVSDSVSVFCLVASLRQQLPERSAG
jgi:hypothetical protein